MSTLKKQKITENIIMKINILIDIYNRVDIKLIGKDTERSPYMIQLSIDYAKSELNDILIDFKKNKKISKMSLKNINILYNFIRQYIKT